MNMKPLLAIALCASLTGCLPMSDERAMRAIEALGYQDVTLHGFVFFGCGRDDMLRKAFSAKDRNGKLVTGYVCGGPLKGATVRID